MLLNLLIAGQQVAAFELQGKTGYFVPWQHGQVRSFPPFGTSVNDDSGPEKVAGDFPECPNT